VFKHETVVNNLLVGMHTHLRTDPLSAAFFWGRARREEIRARERVEEIIEFLEIEDLRDHTVGTLSYGQQKRVELGRALAISPKLLLLDEMVSGMNQEEREDIARFILDLKDELGMTVFMVEHDMGIVMDISDHVCVVNHGRKIAEGTPKPRLPPIPASSRPISARGGARMTKPRSNASRHDHAAGAEAPRRTPGRRVSRCASRNAACGGARPGRAISTPPGASPSGSMHSASARATASRWRATTARNGSIPTSPRR
jgi:energy-coupling factor transporter ATP-binding protein EcfA2